MSLTVSDVIGKVAFFNDAAKYGWIKKNDAKDGDRDVFFRDNDVLYTPGLEVQFDMTQSEKGPRAENVKILETPENKALKDCIEKNRVVEKEVSGTVTFRHKNKTFGFIKRENEAPKTTKKKGKEKKEDFEKIYFCENAEKYRPGMKVSFDIALTDKGPRAVNLQVYENDDDNDNEDSEGGDGSEDGVDIENDDDSEDGDDNEDSEEGADSEDDAESDDGDNNDSEDVDGIENDNDSESGDDIEDGDGSDESDEPEPPKKKKKTKK